MSVTDKVIKRSFDIVFSLLGLTFLWPVILAAWAIARYDTGASGFFLQERVGRNGELFKVVKLRTMRDIAGTNVTTARDRRITPIGAQLRKYKLDELPQLWNVFRGEMSFVGPRPDVPGYLDDLEGEDRSILTLRPGITGPATLKYRNEEQLLAEQEDPQRYNDTVIWPDKVRINREYLAGWSLWKDLVLIKRTLIK